MVDIPAFRLKHGAEFPYDASDAWWRQDGDTREPPAPKDWAHRAARGVVSDLTDRHTIKWGFNDVDEVVRAELVESLAAIIRAADAERSKPTPAGGKEG